MQNETHLRELNYEQECLKSHKSIEEIDSKTLEKIVKILLSGESSYVSNPEEWEENRLWFREKRNLKSEKGRREEAEAERRRKAKEDRKVSY